MRAARNRRRPPPPAWRRILTFLSALAAARRWRRAPASPPPVATVADHWPIRPARRGNGFISPAYRDASDNPAPGLSSRAGRPVDDAGVIQQDAIAAAARAPARRMLRRKGTHRDGRLG